MKVTAHYLTPVAMSLCVRCVSYSVHKIHNEAVILLVCKNRCKKLVVAVIKHTGWSSVSGKNPIWPLPDTANGHCVKHAVNTDQL